MKSILSFAIFIIAISFCNLSEKVQQGGKGEQTSGPAASTPKPSPDRNSVKNELLSISNDMAEASKNGDITFLAQNTTDDFEITDVSGKVQNKNKALADVKEEKSIRSWAITDPELSSVSDNDAVLKYVLNVTLKTGQSGRARVTDTFVKQSERWLLRSEQQTMIR